MALLNGIIRMLSGSVGALTFRQVRNKTVVSEKIVRSSKKRTPRQLRISMRWANMVRMYHCVGLSKTDCFEDKSDGKSNYGAFLSLNSASKPVYLSRHEVRGGGCIAAPYQISDGSLPAVTISWTDTPAAVTDIVLGCLMIDADTTVAQFSNAVVQNNGHFNYGDRIGYVSVRQSVNATTGIPYCQARVWSITLDKSSDAKLWSLCGKEGFSSAAGCLARHASEAVSLDAEYAGCLYSWIHTRKTRDKTLVSSQWLTGHNSVLDAYSSEEAYERAAASYSGKRNR